MLFAHLSRRSRDNLSQHCLSSRSAVAIAHPLCTNNEVRTIVSTQKSCTKHTLLLRGGRFHNPSLWPRAPPHQAQPWDVKANCAIPSVLKHGHTDAIASHNPVRTRCRKAESTSSTRNCVTHFFARSPRLDRSWSRNVSNQAAPRVPPLGVPTYSQ